MRKALGVILTIFLALIVLFPFYYAIIGSFFTASDFATSPARLFPSSLTLANYEKVATHRYFASYVVNSLITGLLGAIIRLVVSYLAAYAFAYFKFKLSKALLFFLLGSMFIPSDLLLVENYITIQKAGLLDSYLGIISTSLLSAAHILMLYQYFCSVPQELHDTASIDGCTDFSYSIRILIPLSLSVLSSLFLQSFVNIFNSYLWPLLVTNKQRMRTVQVGITMLGYSESLNWGPTFAAIVVILIPFTLLFILMRKHVMEAISKGYMHI